MLYRWLFVVLLVSISKMQLSNCLAQGDLTPPGPPDKTFKTLQQIEPRMPISGLPYLITNAGSYYVTANLTGVAGANGITIAANDVSLDLNGFAIIGVSNSLDGIRIGPTGSDAYTNIAIFNGTVRNWDQYGVNAFTFYAYNSRFERLQVSNNKSTGLACGNGAVVSHCVALTNGGYGLNGVSSLFESCVATQNGNEGIQAGSSRVSNCVAEFNGFSGIRCYNGSLVTGCISSYNVLSGIAIGADSVASGNDCLGNNSSGNSNHAGILAFFGPGRIEGNHVSYLNGFGIMVNAGQTGVVVIKNTTFGNTNNIYSIPSGNDVGPWGKAATATSPWANLYN